MEREMEKQREMEMKEQREREMEKQRQREMENQREMEKQMEREMEKQRERVDSLMENHEREKKKGEADELPANVSTSNYGMEREKEKSAKMHESINAPNFQATEPLQDTTTTRITSGHLTIPPPNKAALDRAAMPPPPFLKKSVPSPDTPSSPSTFRAKPPQPSNAYNTPAQTLDGTSASTLIPEPEQIPSFPAANSAQRASNGPRTGPRLNALPNFTSSSLAPPLEAPSQTAHQPPTELPNPPPLSQRPPSPHPQPIPPCPPNPAKRSCSLPNHSPLDWAHLSSSPLANLRGLPPSTPLLRVPPSLLKKFTGRKGKDAWTALGGKVYNITPYLPYHPGGEPELMKCAGRDGTRMFSEVHPWVNWEGMLEACLVGISVGEDEYEGGGALEAMD
ncbi:hypothetical protein DID88_009137 [Monilinia fructigena]|uniref:Cytochrome b5 heme-binding domain-containing protein n=1 Tax=Monilinia fructigena TaxID=38457 RepID=A0A395IEL7_9HELO|nr:hypothetical protein DID88_009137 [Monilinia fructigena]